MITDFEILLNSINPSQSTYAFYGILTVEEINRLMDVFDYAPIQVALNTQTCFTTITRL